MTVFFLAHIVGERPPGFVSWLAAIALFGGLLALIWVRGRARIICVVIAVAGLGGTVDDLFVRSLRPARPNLVIRLVSPSPRTHLPLWVKVCGSTRQGEPESPTARGRHLLVTLDNVQVAEARTNLVEIPVTRGVHELRVEITSPQHQEFLPPLIIQREIDVVGPGVSYVPACRG